MSGSVITLLFMGVLFCTHPLLLWAVSEGRALELAAYALAIYSLNGLMRYGDVRAILTAAFCFAFALFADAALLYVMLVLVALIAFLAPPLMMRRAPFSFYLAMLFPSVTVLAGFLHINHFFGPLPYGLAQMTGLHVSVPAVDYHHFPWKQHYAGNVFPPLFLVVLAAFTAFPLAILGPFSLRSERLVAVPMLLAMLAPLVAALFAAQLPFNGYPVGLVALLSVPAFHAAIQLARRGRRGLAVLMLAVGWLGGAGLLSSLLAEKPPAATTAFLLPGEKQ